MSKKKQKALPPPFAEETKDARYSGVFEVFVPVEGRVRPLRVPLRFDSKDAAENWIFSDDGEAEIARLRRDSQG